MKLVFAMAAAVMLSACAQAPKKQAFNTAANAHIQQVLVATNTNQEEYPAIILAHPGASFGLIGGLIAAADMQSKSTQLTNRLDVQQTRLQERFAGLLKEKLEAVGYKVQLQNLKKGVKPDESLSQIKQTDIKTDAYLIVHLTGGYAAAGPSSDYFPYINAKITKHDAKSDSILYEDTISYGYTFSNSNQTVHLASPQEFRYANFDSLIRDPAVTRNGLTQGLDAIAAQITNDLKK